MSGSAVRPYRPEDEPDVRQLIEADRLPGQPCCTPQKLAAARSGRVPVADWTVPARPQTRVLTDAEDCPCGIIAYLAWTDVHTGLVCRVHAREDPPALRALLGHALAALKDCRQVDAFVDAPPGPLGPGGLPRTRRRATHDALLQSGFTGRRQGCYLHCALPAEPPPAKLVADVLPCEFPRATG
ncbi:hypothetical protein [Streptomyces sp. UG1]|uniref:hypothetical protein n=1 Tax=Streptomyces sp. UG1 TaxID=3417652 RepID=UPI003CF6B56E